APDGIVLGARAHHLIMDGWSGNLLFQATCRAYNRLEQDPDAFLDAEQRFIPTLRDAELYQWSACRNEDREFWRGALSNRIGLPLIHAIADRQASGVVPEMKHQHQALPAALMARVTDAADRVSVPLSDFLTAIVGIYLARVSGAEQFALTSNFMNRTRRTLGVPGHFTNILPIPVEIDPSVCCEAAVAAIASDLAEARRHGRFPFSDIVRAANIDPAHAHVSVNTLLLRRGPKIDGATVPFRWIQGPELGLDFVFSQFGDDAPAELAIWFNAAKFDESTISGHLRRLLDFAVEVCARFDAPVQAIPLLGEEERHQTLVEFNDTAVAYPQGETVIDLFAQSARSEIPAIVDGEDVLS
ncbi:MAG: hypothetical protein GY788_20660, partial [bacterium]|nr:hypothetical protein [bacterium]